MSRKISIDPQAYEFLQELNSIGGYLPVAEMIHAIAENVRLEESVYVHAEFEVGGKQGGESLSFTESRYVEINEITISYTWSDADGDRVYITDISL